MRKFLYRTLVFIGILSLMAGPLKPIFIPLAALYILFKLVRFLWVTTKSLWQHYRTWQLMRSEPNPARFTPSSITLPCPAFNYSGDNLADFALALAWPMAAHLPNNPDDGHSRYPLQLHYFGLRTDLQRTQIRQQLPEKLRKHWFALDLEHLQSSDEPHAAMAFACVRLSFYLQSAYHLGWLDNALYQKILLLNSERAKECFSHWQAFASAFADGRSQWLARGRSDILGSAVSAEQARLWTYTAGHPWQQLPWPSLEKAKHVGISAS